MRSLIIITSIVLFSIQSLYTQNFWESTSGPYGPGYVSAIEAKSNGMIYVAIDDVGLYRSLDNGLSFEYTSNVLSNTSICSISIDPDGDIFVGDQNWPGKGVFKSTDEGNSWLSILDLPMIQAIVIDSDHIIYVATRFDGLYQSSDTGNSWNQVNLNPVLGTIMSLASNLSGDLFISGFVDGWAPPRTMRSTNKGESWDTLNIPVEGYISNFSFSNGGYIVASFHPYFDSSAFFISNDNGNSWIRKNIVRSYFGINNLVFDSPSNAFYAVVYDYNHTYDWDILKSTDYGNTWLNTSTIIYAQPDLFSLVSDQEGKLFVGDVNGLKYSTDSGYNWVQSDSGFFTRQTNHLTLLPGHRIYCNTWNGTFRYNNEIPIWQKDSVFAGSFLISNTNNYFLSNGIIRKSNNNGITWSIVFDPKIYGFYSFTTELSKLSNGYLFSGGTIYGGVHGTGFSQIWRSTDEGLTWITVYGHGNDDIIYTITNTPNDILLAGSGSSGDGIVRSTDSGNTWNPVTDGLPSDVHCFVIRAKSDGKIFAGTYDNGIFRSTNNGDYWESINNGLNTTKITSIAINSIGKIYIGTPNGVFVSTDNGDNWSIRNNGLIDFEVNSLLCDSSDYLYVATNGCGVFRSIFPTTSVDELQNNIELFYLSQNYPNPFNPSTKIKFEIPSVTLRQAQSDNWVTLKVYDVLGNEIATLVDEEKQPGVYEVEFSAK
ncbi:MAG: hypothetical protein MUE91_03410, partial [Ignavibacteriaceae bacterium]|nr:hypothetical protein [Ignavibacteriaceae bacterium]